VAVVTAAVVVVMVEEVATVEEAATVAAAAVATLGFLLKVYPGFHQDNAPVIALILPTWYGLALGLLSAWRGLRRLPVRARAGSKS
jgi:hypothetical protein